VWPGRPASMIDGAPGVGGQSNSEIAEGDRLQFGL
jgi:hypothetical protein